MYTLQHVDLHPKNCLKRISRKVLVVNHLIIPLSKSFYCMLTTLRCKYFFLNETNLSKECQYVIRKLDI